MNQWSILYRGPLSSCNYSCSYCPFAKTTNSREELEDDARRLLRFVDWVEGRSETIGVLFTPWGEALHIRAYQDAITRLSHLPNVSRVAIQTNLAARLDWLEAVNRERVALWTTYHPTQTTRRRFLSQCAELDRIGIAHSVGVVGITDQADEIAQLRAELNPSTYLWINAYKRQPDYYSEADIRQFSRIDPLFPFNTRYHPTKGKLCRAGSTVFSVDGDGTIRRCHFIKQSLGNIYDAGFERALIKTPCTNDTCGCHIGYVHVEELELYSFFGDRVLERIPSTPLWR
ncbi:STM4011 family radical SAM protein [Verrucomicrobiota bacterium sgz303538]